MKINFLSGLQRFMWWCAGARIEYLESDECKSDQAKYFGIGGTILFTALMAGFAGAYAFFTAFKQIEGVDQIFVAGGEVVNQDIYTRGSYVKAGFFGVFWGLLIFNLDRYIVSTIKDDGKATISRTELINASPRIILAIVLGLVISTPIELKIYEKEISVEIQNLIHEKRAEIGAADSSLYSQKSYLQQRIALLEPKVDQLNLGDAPSIENDMLEDAEAELINLKNAYEQAKASYRGANKGYQNAYANCKLAQKKQNPDISDRELYKNCDQQTSNMSRRVRNLRKSRNEANRQVNIKQSQVDSLKNLATSNALGNRARLQAELAQYKKELQLLDQEIMSKQKNYDNIAKQYTGFMASCLALERLQKKEMDVMIKVWFITLLFIFIELAPVLFKLMTEAGAYDKKIETDRYISKISNDKRISDLNDEINTEIEISSEKNRGRIKAELQANDKLLETIALAQAEIADNAITKWKENELNRLDNSLDHIIIASNESDYALLGTKWESSDNNIYCFFDGGKDNLVKIEKHDTQFGSWSMDGTILKISVGGLNRVYSFEKGNDMEIRLTDSITGSSEIWKKV